MLRPVCRDVLGVAAGAQGCAGRCGRCAGMSLALQLVRMINEAVGWAGWPPRARCSQCVKRCGERIDAYFAARPAILGVC